MKRQRVLPGLLLAAVAVAAPASSHAVSWFVECSAGFALFSPDDVNSRFAGQQRRIEFMYRDSYEAQQRLSGGAFAYLLEEPAGSGLQGLRNGAPISLRIGRSVGPRLAVFTGLQFLGRQKSSWLQQTYRVNDARADQVTAPGAYVVEVGFPECYLDARAWFPHLGAAFEFYRRRRWAASARLAAGPLFAAVRTVEAQRYKKTDSDGYWTEWRQTYDMKGRGTGIGMEAMARLTLDVLPRLGLFVEGGYSLRSSSRFSGPGSAMYQYHDANAAQNPQQSQWQGPWLTRRVGLSREWGFLEYELSGNDLAGYADTGKFRLDLSGWQLAAGLALKL